MVRAVCPILAFTYVKTVFCNYKPHTIYTCIYKTTLVLNYRTLIILYFQFQAIISEYSVCVSYFPLVTMSGTPPIPERVDSLQIDQQLTSPSGTDSSELNSNHLHSTGEESVGCEASLVEYETPDFFKETYNTLNSFLDKGDLCDVEIQCGEKSFKCHRIILASISGYFRAMFLGTLAESKQNVVKIQDIDENVLENMIRYAYSGKFTITVDNVQGVLYVASILQIENVASACSDFMKEHLHPDNCIQVYAFAMQHNRQQLINFTQDFITEHFLDVSKTPEFMSMSVNVIDSIINSSNLNISSEVEAYEAVMKWINHDTEDRKQHLAKLLAKVKLPLINTHYLMETVATNELVRINLECRDYLDEAKYYQMYVGNLLSDVQITERTRPRKSYAGMSMNAVLAYTCLFVFGGLKSY